MVVAENILKEFLRKTFDIRQGEFRRALLMQLNVFLIISTLLIVKPAVNSLFLSEFGVERLPVAFVLVAIFAGLFSTLYSRILSRMPLNRIIVRTLLTSVITLVIFGLLLRLNLMVGSVLFLFYIWVAIFAVLSASQFWILANVVFNAREAKRLFGFIGSGAIAGGIFGGYLTSILAPIIGSENLLFVGAFVLVFCIPITRNIWKQNVIPTQTYYQRRKRIVGFGENPIKLIKNSKHLTYLASIIGISVIVAKLVDYQFNAIASFNIQDADELTSFFGFWFSTFSVISLIIQLFITRRVVGIFGVGTSLFFLPAGIMIGALLIFFFPGLVAAILIRMADGSLKQSINKAATELLALPIPAEIKNQTKSFIDVFVDSLATGIGGLILIFLVNGLDLSTKFISLMILALFIPWLFFAIKIRQEYIKSFKLKVGQIKGDSGQKTFDLQEDSVLNGLRKVLKDGSEKQILFVLRKIKEINDVRLFENIRPLLTHNSAEIRWEALQNLYFFKSQNLNEEVEAMISDPDQRVKVSAFAYLLRHGNNNRVNIFDQYLNSTDYHISSTALVSLATETRDNPEMKTRFNLNGRVNQMIEELSSIRDHEKVLTYKLNILKTIGQANLTEYYSFIELQMKDENTEVVKQAITSSGNTLSPVFIDHLIPLLLIENQKESAKAAIVNYGKPIIKILSEIVQKPDTPVELVRIIPSVAENINSNRSIDFLFTLLDYEDLTVKLEALRSMNNMKIRFPHLKINKNAVIQKILTEASLYLDTLAALYAQIKIKPASESLKIREQEEKQWDARKSLILLLERRLDGNLERIFRLLGLKYPPEDIITIYKGIQSKTPEMRMNAVEYLDNILEPNLKKVLIPIVETALLETISDVAIKNLNLKIPDELHCFAMLLEGKDLKIKLAVLYLISQLKDKKYLKLAEQYAKSENIKVKTHANDALQAILSG